MKTSDTVTEEEGNQIKVQFFIKNNQLPFLVKSITENY